MVDQELQTAITSLEAREAELQQNILASQQKIAEVEMQTGSRPRAELARLNRLSETQAEVSSQLNILRDSQSAAEAAARTSAFKQQTAQEQSRQAEQRARLQDIREREAAGVGAAETRVADLPPRTIDAASRQAQQQKFVFQDPITQETREATPSEAFQARFGREVQGQSRQTFLERRLSPEGRKALKLARREIQIPLFIGAGGVSVPAGLVKEGFESAGKVGKAVSIFIPTTIGQLAAVTAVSAIPIGRVFQRTKIPKVTFIGTRQDITSAAAVTRVQFVTRVAGKPARRGEIIVPTFFRQTDDVIFSRTFGVGISGETRLTLKGLRQVKPEVFVGSQGAATIIAGREAVQFGKVFVGTSRGEGFTAGSLAGIVTEKELSAIAGITASRGQLRGFGRGLIKKITPQRERVFEVVPTTDFRTATLSQQTIQRLGAISEAQAKNIVQAQLKPVTITPISPTITAGTLTAGLVSIKTPTIKPVTTQATETQILPRVTTRAAQFSVQIPLQVQSQSLGLRFRQQQQVRQLQKTQQIQVQTQIQAQTLRTRAIPLPRLKQVQVLRTAVIPPIVPFPTIPVRFIAFPKFRTPKTFAPSPKGQFVVSERRFGVFRPIGTTRTFAQAISLGAGRVSRTLGATFKIKPITPRGISGGIKAPKGFRRGKGLTFIEAPKLRLSTAKEVQSIQLAKGGIKV